MPKFDLNAGRLDEKRIEDGVWWEIWRNQDSTFGGRPLPGVPGDVPALLIRPADVRWERALDDARRPHVIEIRSGALDDAVSRRITAQAVAKALWRGCHNLTIGGADLVWSEDRAADLLAQRAWWNLSDFIVRVAHDRSALAAQEEAKASGN